LRNTRLWHAVGQVLRERREAALVDPGLDVAVLNGDHAALGI
jgi:hypothetical protein